MNALCSRPPRGGRFLLHVLTLGYLFATAGWPARGAEPSDADAAWAAVRGRTLPPTPESWRTQRPSPEDLAAFRKDQSTKAGEAADAARDFLSKYPQSTNAPQARRMEMDMTRVAVTFGDKARQPRLIALENAALKDPALDEDSRYRIRNNQVQRAILAGEPGPRAVTITAYERAARELIREFPRRPEPYSMLMSAANSAEGPKARQIAQEIVDGPAPDAVKERARGLLKKFEAVGKPLALRFTAVDGRAVDLQKMKGQVVLVDFWATWCGPCVAELPNVKAAYQKLHPKGFEILGISFDKEQGKLESFVQERGISWPQYFDGKGWDNVFGRQFGINSIPTLWLVDKQGVLRDVNARGDLESKVEKLLAE